MKTLLVLAFIFYNFVLVSSAEKASTYIIHLDFNLMPTPFTSHFAWHSSMLSSSSSSKLIYSYTNAIHGFSAKLTPSQLQEIQKSPAFLASTSDIQLQLATTHSLEFLGLDSFSGAWPASDFGRDVIIGVVDTGVWPESKSFSNDEGFGHIPSRWRGGCFGGLDFNSSLCNKKLIGVRYFNKGLKAAYPKPKFYDSARDIRGHGTHVSSTAAGNFIHGTSYFGYGTGTAKGMAPRARVAVYKVVFSEEYDLFSLDVIAVIDSAIEDGIDVLSLSIVSLPPLYHDPVAIATFAAMEKSIFVSSAAGNSGPYLNTIIGGTPWHLTVGAGTIGRSFTGNIALGSGAFITGLSFCPLSPNILHNLPIIFLKDCGREEGLQKYAKKIVVCSIMTKDDDDDNDELLSAVSSFQDSGVAGAVLIWSKTTISYLPYLPDEEIGFPAIVLNAANGKIVLDYIGNNNDKAATATLLFKETIHGTKPAPGVAMFSSRGPSQACPFILKPDVLAPGHHILASWQEKNPANLITTGQLINSFSIQSGTSMASPHAAGVAALLKGAHPDWSPAAIRSAMMTTADVLDNTLTPIKEQGLKIIATPLAIGAGHINPNRALNPGLVYEADVDDYVNLLCAMNLTTKQIRAITWSHRGCFNPSLDLNYPSFMAYFLNCDNNNDSKSIIFERTLTNVGDDKSNYYAKLVSIEGFNITVVPGTLFFGKKGEKKRYKLKIYGPCLKKGTILHGSVEWRQIGGSQTVRSPIVVAGLNPDMGGRMI